MYSDFQNKIRIENLNKIRKQKSEYENQNILKNTIDSEKYKSFIFPNYKCNNSIKTLKTLIY